jgi:glutamate/tyrosine decarboxylase-like PLP-dependent enzyme
LQANDYAPLLSAAERHAGDYLRTIAARHAGALLSGGELRSRLGKPLPEAGDDAVQVIEELASAGAMGTTASQGPRYFGFVTGGALPAALAADWLTSAWDQNAQIFAMSPLAAVAEEIAAEWLKQLLRLPQAWSVGFVTGAQMANFTALLAARHHVLAMAGWNVESDGLFGAPAIEVFVGEQAHRTILSALRMLGLGEKSVTRVGTDDQGRMLPSHLARALAASTGPCIVCAQVGNVNTGAADPLPEIVAVARERNAWVHVDGAFGAWAAVSESMRHLTNGIERADSLATDAHKWLNVPYDSGLVFTAHPRSHRDALVVAAQYLVPTEGERNPREFTPDESRRARGIAVYAALRSLGREGVRDLVERCCECARQMAAELRSHPQVRVLNEVVLNQVLIRFAPLPGDARNDEAFTEEVVAGVQAEGTCWFGMTQRQGKRAARISICNWRTTAEDVARSAEAIARVIQGLNGSRAECSEGR